MIITNLKVKKYMTPPDKLNRLIAAVMIGHDNEPFNQCFGSIEKYTPSVVPWMRENDMDLNIFSHIYTFKATDENAEEILSIWSRYLLDECRIDILETAISSFITEKCCNSNDLYNKRSDLFSCGKLGYINVGVYQSWFKELFSKDLNKHVWN